MLIVGRLRRFIWRRMGLFQRYPVLERGIINLKSGTVFRGVIYRKVNGYLVLVQVEMLSDRDSKMDPKVTNGEVLVRLDDVDFIQIVGGQ